MSESSSTAATTQDGTELASALTTKRKPRSTTIRKKPAAKASAKKATPAKKAGKKSTTKKATAARKSSTTRSSTAKPKRTTSAKRATTSLKTDLKNLSNEGYATGDFTRGAIVLLEQEGVEILRDALMVMLSSKTPLIGGMVSGVALETLLDKVTDTYKKATVADRKALRAVINWLRGDANTDEATQQNLVALLHGQQPSRAVSSLIEPDATPSATDLKLKPLRKTT